MKRSPTSHIAPTTVDNVVPLLSAPMLRDVAHGLNFFANSAVSETQMECVLGATGNCGRRDDSSDFLTLLNIVKDDLAPGNKNRIKETPVSPRLKKDILNINRLAIIIDMCDRYGYETLDADMVNTIRKAGTSFSNVLDFYEQEYASKAKRLHEVRLLTNRIQAGNENIRLHEFPQDNLIHICDSPYYKAPHVDEEPLPGISSHFKPGDAVSNDNTGASEKPSATPSQKTKMNNTIFSIEAAHEEEARMLTEVRDWKKFIGLLREMSGELSTIHTVSDRVMRNLKSTVR